MAEFASRSALGKRFNQEDIAWFDATAGLFVIADGMGGHASGEVASNIVTEVTSAALRGEVTTVPVLLQPCTQAAAVDFLKALLSAADTSILAAVSLNPRLAGMGTTAIAGILGDGWCVFAHCGDSRVYSLKKGKLKQETKDHTLVQVLVEAGVIDAAQARTHARRHVITAHLGGKATVVQLSLTVESGDILLLSTDGLTDVLDDATILQAMLQGGTAEALSQRLVALAVAAGAHDNVTAMIVKV